MPPTTCNDQGISEVVGSLALIGIVTLAFAIAGVYLLSRPAPEKIPEIRVNFSNTSTNLSITHVGGESIPNSSFVILVNNRDRTKNFTNSSGTNPLLWSIGDTITYTFYPTDYPLRDAQIVYTGSANPGVLASWDFTYSGMPTPGPTYPGGHTIAALASPGGFISPVGPISVEEGSDKTFTIGPGFGYHITDVIVDGSSVGQVTTYTFQNVISDHTISASFEIDRHVITSSAGTNGDISPLGTTGLDHGDEQTYTITPSTGYHIADVTVDSSSVGQVASYTFQNVISDHTISASFEINRYVVTASAGINGIIAPSGVVMVPYGYNQLFTITSNHGYHIFNVLVDGVSVGPQSSYNFANVTADHTISASYAINAYLITASAGANGAISPSGGFPVAYRGNQTFTITPDIGYHIADVLVDGFSNGTVSSYTFNEVDSDHTISALFAINMYIITPSAGQGGSISPSNPISIPYNGNQTFTIAPNTGYNIEDVRVDGVSMGPVTNYAFPNVQANHTISASFVPRTFTITSSAGANGAISPSGTLIVNYGINQTFTITPNPGYHVAEVTVDSGSVGPQLSYTFSNVVTNHTISATFAINTYTITPSVAGGNGAISPSTPQTVNYGSTPVFTFTPNPNYQLINVTVDGSPVTPSGNSYTFPAVTANHTIVASFGLPPPTLSTRNPTSGNRGWPVSIALTGTGFQPGAEVRLRQSGYTDIVATGVTVSSPTQIATSINLLGVAAGTWNIVVINPDGQESNTMTYTVNSPTPTLSARNPTSGARGWPVSITLTGTGFQSGATVNMTRTGSIPIEAYNIVVVSSTQITCTFDLVGATKATNWAICVTNTDRKWSGTLAFSITSVNPTVTSITPASGKRGTTVTITSIAGTNFQPGATVLFATNTGMNQNTMTLTNVNVESKTKISGTLVIPAGQLTTTAYYVRVTNTDATNGRSGSRIFTVTV